ncbi:MAG: YaiI/YqxD family protein [Legionella sp.]
MKIWIDGDACPKQIKDIIFRAAIKRKITTILVANHFVTTPLSMFIKKVVVPAGFDAADQFIANHLVAQDLVITADIPLADLVITKQAIALNPRGELYSNQNIKQVLAIRNLNESLRNNGLINGGVNKLNHKDIQNFSNNFDKILHNHRIKK